MSGDLKAGARIGSVRPLSLDNNNNNNNNNDNDDVWFNIIDGNADNYFDIENLSGELILVRPLQPLMAAAATSSRSPLEFNLRIALNDNVFGMAREVIEAKVAVSGGGEGGWRLASLLDGPLRVEVAEDTVVGDEVELPALLEATRNGSLRYRYKDR